MSSSKNELERDMGEDKDFVPDEAFRQQQLADPSLSEARALANQNLPLGNHKILLASKVLV